MSANSIKLALSQALEAAFRQCEAVGAPLNEVQRQILQQVSQTLLLKSLADSRDAEPDDNPLSALTEPQRQVLIDYIVACDRNDQDWKATLLSDWIQGRNSGSVQFLRDRYGFDWINRVQPQHLSVYANFRDRPLQVGDRLQVASRLWEWIPEDREEEPEWIACTLIALNPTVMGEGQENLNGIVRFDNGVELEIEGLTDWNQRNWRRSS